MGEGAGVGAESSSGAPSSVANGTGSALQPLGTGGDVAEEAAAPGLVAPEEPDARDSDDEAAAYKREDRRPRRPAASPPPTPRNPEKTEMEARGVTARKARKTMGCAPRTDSARQH